MPNLFWLIPRILKKCCSICSCNSKGVASVVLYRLSVTLNPDKADCMFAIYGKEAHPKVWIFLPLKPFFCPAKDPTLNNSINNIL